MADPDAYVALITSLPRHEELFVAKQPPLSRLRLEMRLKALSVEDAATLATLEQCLSWPAYGLETTEVEAFARGRAALDAVPQPELRSILRDRLQMRSLIAALRRRKAGGGPPPAQWGFGGIARRIAANWQEPAFGLERPYPWLGEAAGLLERGDALGFERLVLTESRAITRRRAEGHYFDFIAVAAYVLIWNIHDRWARANAAAAARRFHALADAALGARTDIFAER